MVEKYLAHSQKDGVPSQSYKQHVSGVLHRVREFAVETQRYHTGTSSLYHTAEKAAIYHDLGKLDEENQQTLMSADRAHSLAINHVDAGTCFLKQNNSIVAALAVYSHHIGLPDICQVNSDGERLAFRDAKIADIVDQRLPQYVALHNKIFQDKTDYKDEVSGDSSVYFRILLSCLVDADHTDTAAHYQNYPKDENKVLLRPEERLDKLNRYIEGLKKTDTQRSRLRSIMYNQCRDAQISQNIAYCDSPVGSGKTTAIMAHLLSQAKERKLRRIFVILPFTNIIRQCTKVYRDALVLDGEEPQDVVAELHHRADFESIDSRHLASLWRAPIIVTTAVAFFETLASSSTRGLRKLHELPGSAIFVDEAHAAVPVKYLPLVWRWMNIYANEWSCYFLMGSGSLNRFWEIEEITEIEKITKGAEDIRPCDIPSLIDDKLKNELSIFESGRIDYQHDLKPQSLTGFAQRVMAEKGPRIVILNTVQSAAVVADYFEKTFGRKSIEHLSTALLPKHRAQTLDRINKRLNDKDDTNWTLVATSCVEAGMDFSFCTGFREISSLTSLLQAAGRVNRNGEHGVSKMFSFRLCENDRLKTNPSLNYSCKVLCKFIERGMAISPSLTTESIRHELKQYGAKDHISKQLVEKEQVLAFPYINDNFKVIESDMRIAVVDGDLAKRIIKGNVDWQELQQNSLQIVYHKLLQLKVLRLSDEIYHWTLDYNDFLGYMAGILQNLDFKDEPIVF